MFFDFDLPQHLIAQEPTAKRDESRLLVLHRATGEIEHRIFRDLPTLLSSGDLLVLNDTKVLPARLIGRRGKTGGKWEGLFLRKIGDDWELLAQTRGFPQIGEELIVEPGELTLTLTGRTEDRHWLVRPHAVGSPEELLASHGQVPLPPYIRKGRARKEDEERYQTVYAARPGSVAAPTAGLHMTPEVLASLASGGIETARVTLHVGLGTFAPVKVDDPTRHEIHAEWCELSAETVERIRSTRARGGRVIGVGTTTARTLESAVGAGGLTAFRGETKLFIHPPYDFQVIQGLITNFHLPRTTLLLLVQALAGGECLRRAYLEAVGHEYRFYSYGDAMLIL